MINNTPKKPESLAAMRLMVSNILIAVENKFGEIVITYGFVGSELNRYIQANSSSGTCPSIDQHASFELNTKNNPICPRAGFSCDFTVVGYEQDMTDVVEFIVNTLEYDKLYFYGANRPLHVSVNEQPQRHLQIMGHSGTGRRYPKKKAYGENAIQLIKDIKNGC
ncbi:MAG: hypothetical protein HRU22_09190 [Gammaproteobacteria bacterium]|nr:hypothetical protein [Gammaproteobacteria bacterium]